MTQHTGSDRSPTGTAAPTTADGAHRSRPRVTVVICAYTEDRWDLLVEAVESIARQTLVPHELILSIDHNRDLFERCRARWSGAPDPVAQDPGAPDPVAQSSGARGNGGFPVRVVENRYAGRLGSARTTAAEMADGDILAFLDDDASADPAWLARMVEPFEDGGIIAVGGAPLPRYATSRPSWFPTECDWVFGCVYRGLPTAPAPIRHVIGAAMAVRTKDLLAIGGFHSDNHDDMDMCHRLVHYAPGTVVWYQPDAVVRHYVSAERLTWHYFWRRCFFVNRGKVRAFHQMGGARNLTAETRFARTALTRGVATNLGQFVRGDVGGLLRATSLCAAIALAGLGYAVGTVELTVGDRLRAR